MLITFHVECLDMLYCKLQVYLLWIACNTVFTSTIAKWQYHREREREMDIQVAFPILFLFLFQITISILINRASQTEERNPCELHLEKDLVCTIVLLLFDCLRRNGPLGLRSKHAPHQSEPQVIKILSNVFQANIQSKIISLEFQRSPKIIFQMFKSVSSTKNMASKKEEHKNQETDRLVAKIKHKKKMLFSVFPTSNLLMNQWF